VSLAGHKKPGAPDSPSTIHAEVLARNGVPGSRHATSSQTASVSAYERDATVESHPFGFAQGRLLRKGTRKDGAPDFKDPDFRNPLLRDN